MKNAILKGASLFMCIMMLQLPIFAATPLKRGVSVPVRLATSVNSKTTTSIEAYVDRDIKSADGTLVIKAGTPVNVESNIQAARRVGKPGTISLQFTSTTAVDGTRIVLAGSKAEATGISKKSKALGLGLGLGIPVAWPCLFVLCMKGGEATIDGNTVYDNIYTAYDQEIGQ